MSGYAGIPCPVCGKQFVEGDDVVVCPDCGTPHHRSCYQELGRCVNADKHAAGFLWQAPQAAPEQQDAPQPMVCARCGTSNEAGALRCRLCGFPLGGEPETNGQPQQPPQPAQERPESFSQYMNRQQEELSHALGVDNPTQEFTSGITVGDLADYIGPNHLSFIYKFRAMMERSGISFNLCAFFFSAFYCFYRKMYKIGAAALVIIAGVYSYSLYTYIPYFIDYMTTGVMATSGELYEAVLFTTNLMRVVTLLVSLVLGFFFNRLYLKRCLNGIRTIKGQSMGAQYSAGISGCTGSYRYCLARKGGVDRVSVVTVIAVLFVLYIVATYIFMNGQMPL